jgi:hypothetical protein
MAIRRDHFRASKHFTIHCIVIPSARSPVKFITILMSACRSFGKDRSQSLIVRIQRFGTLDDPADRPHAQHPVRALHPLPLPHLTNAFRTPHSLHTSSHTCHNKKPTVPSWVGARARSAFTSTASTTYIHRAIHWNTSSADYALPRSRYPVRD